MKQKLIPLCMIYITIGDIYLLEIFLMLAFIFYELCLQILEKFRAQKLLSWKSYVGNMTEEMQEGEATFFPRQQQNIFTNSMPWGSKLGVISG